MSYYSYYIIAPKGNHRDFQVTGLADTDNVSTGAVIIPVGGGKAKCPQARWRRLMVDWLVKSGGRDGGRKNGVPGLKFTADIGDDAHQLGIVGQFPVDFADGVDNGGVVAPAAGTADTGQ
jgi:hypothetical protein